jgi:hypothetical protein
MPVFLFQFDFVSFSVNFLMCRSIWPGKSICQRLKMCFARSGVCNVLATFLTKSPRLAISFTRSANGKFVMNSPARQGVVGGGEAGGVLNAKGKTQR